jgi:hypothetical protein
VGSVLLWMLVVATACVALVAFLKTRSLARRLKQLTDQYWDLRYQHGELRAVVRRLDPETAKEEEAAAAARQAPGAAFIPLTSVKRSSEVDRLPDAAAGGLRPVE